MARLPSEILSIIFCYLKEVHFDLDLMSASLVCTSWYLEGFPLFNLECLNYMFLLVCKNDVKSEDMQANFQRLSSLLAESRQLGLNYCDYIYEIVITLEYINDNILAVADSIHKIISLRVPNLHTISLYTISSGRIIDFANRICPSDQPIKTIELEFFKDASQDTTRRRRRHRRRREEICLFLLNRFRDTLCKININDIELNPDIQNSIIRCSCIKSIALQCITFPHYMAIRQDLQPAALNANEMIIRLATAFPNLVTLTIDSQLVSSVQLCELLTTQCPRMEEITLGVDNSFDDESLRFLARNTPELTHLSLTPCEGVCGKEVWIEGDIRWQKLKRLTLEVTDFAPLFLEQVLRDCTELIYIAFNKDLPIEKMKEYYFHPCYSGCMETRWQDKGYYKQEASFLSASSNEFVNI